MGRLRSVCGLLVTFGATIGCGSLAMLGGLLPRRFDPFDRIVSGWSRAVLGSLGVRGRVTWQGELPRDTPAVYMANHQSLLDTPLLFSVLSPAPRFVAKKSLAWVPFLGWAMVLNDFVFVDRGDREAAIASLARAGEKIRRGTSVLVFPEGTRGSGEQLQPFKKGGFLLAIGAGVPIVPLRITGTARLLGKHRGRPAAGEVHVAVGRPIPTADLTAADRDELLAQVRRAMAELPAPEPAAVVSELR